MKFAKLIVASSFLIVSASSCNGQKVTPGGLHYEYLTKGKGTVAAKAGDMAEINVLFKMGDSVIINTLEMNHNKPVDQVLQAPGYRGDLFEGMLLMKEGDEMLFTIDADSMFANIKQPKPDFIKPNDKATWKVTMVSLKTSEQVAAEKAEKIKTQGATDDKTILKYFEENNIKIEGDKKSVKEKIGGYKKGTQIAHKTASGMYYITLQEGTGAAAEKGKMAVVDYTGMKLDGTKFDSNVDPAFNHVSPFEFKLGANQVIKGWDEMVSLMKVGQKVKVFIPSMSAYGERGAGKDIKPFEVLVFEIELKHIK